MGRHVPRVLRTPLGVAALALSTVLLFLVVFGPAIWGEAATAVNTNDMLAKPSAEHWAGTDSLGRDIVARVFVATRLSVVLALAGTVIGASAGLLLGVLPYLLGRRLGRGVTGAVNIAVAFPSLLLALFFAVIFGVGATGAVLAIGFAGAPAFARLTQTLVAGVASRDYVASAQVAGVGPLRRLFRHILPNVAEPLLVSTTISAGGALLAFAGLSFLGLGVQSPAYDWGRLLYDGIATIYSNPAAALAPGIAVVIAGLTFSLSGEALAKQFGVPVLVGPLAGATRRSRSLAVVPPASDADPGTAAGHDLVLDVRDLDVTFGGPNGPIRPVRGVSFTVRRGEAVGIVGESGSGKSLTALAIAQLVDDTGHVSATRHRLAGTDLLAGDAAAHRKLLGTSLAMVFQDPTTSFNPTHRVGRQLAEVAVHHQGLGRGAAMARAVDRLDAVRIPDAGQRARQYPHEFSGGMRQRAMIGMGLMGTPALIIADEPTTALDVTVQRQVLDLLASIRASDDLSLVLISHDVTVVAEMCDRVLVMYAGRIVEDLPAAELMGAARHPYSRALLAAVPDMQTDVGAPLATIPGRPADPADLPSGCAFAPRCPLADTRCVAEQPPLEIDDAGRRVACWHAGEELSVGSGRAGVADRRGVDNLEAAS